MIQAVIFRVFVKEEDIHELSIMQNIMHIVERQKIKKDFKTLEKINLEIGEISGINPAFLKEAFNSIKPGTYYENAEIIINLIPLTYKCVKCGKTVDKNHEKSKCKCGGIFIMKTGRELNVIDIEVET
jgi:hydrogenase nickel incorporation protein HypA/HybF